MSIVIEFARIIGRGAFGFTEPSGVVTQIVAEMLRSAIGRTTEKDIDARIQKIEAARENLREALSAIDEMERSAQDNRRELNELRTALVEKEAERESLSNHNENLKKLAEIETDTIRRAFGIPSKRRVIIGYIASFLGGIFATWVITLIYDFLIKPEFQSYFHLSGT